MKRAPLLALVAAASVALATPAVAADEPTTDGPTASYIVQFTPGSDRAAEVAKAKALGMTVTYEYTKALNGMAVLANKGQLTALEKNPNVRLIEADGIVTKSATQSPVTWGLDRIDQRDLPLSSSYSYTTTASNVTAYIIDTGILASHTDLGGRVKAGYTSVNDGRGTTDCDGHGTHVAGTVGGNTYGVAKGVSLVPVRVLDCTGSGTWSGVVAGIDWVAQNAQKPAVANMSLGGGASASVDTAVANLVNAGVTVAVAAGNDNANACNYSPARAASAITVGSTTSTDARSSFSNFGTCVDIFAPGSNITSTYIGSNTATAALNGTSMASPHVAGAAALYLAANSSAPPASVATALTSSATPNKVTGAGTGSPTALLFTGSLAPAAPGSPTITAVSPSSGTVGTSVTITGTNLAGATVTFGNTDATDTVSTDTSLTTRVPTGATSGPITVTNTVSSASIAFTVLTVPPAPSNVRASAGTKGTASVSWAQSGNGGSVIQKSTVTVIRVSTSGAEPAPVVITGTGTSARITGLTRGAVYRFSVVATNAQGDSPAGTSGNITAR